MYVFSAPTCSSLTTDPETKKRAGSTCEDICSRSVPVSVSCACVEYIIIFSLEPFDGLVSSNSGLLY